MKRNKVRFNVCPAGKKNFFIGLGIDLHYFNYRGGNYTGTWSCAVHLPFVTFRWEWEEKVDLKKVMEDG